MKIGPFDCDKRILIVAEIGNNHEGRFDVAQELTRRAAASKADAVKFQTFRTEHYVSASDRARFERLKGFELSIEQFARLAQLARGLGLLFLSTPFDLASAAGLEPLVDAFKIASGDNTFFPLIARVADTGKPMILSTGLSDLELIRRTVAFIQARPGRSRIPEQLAVLHCVSSYPVQPEEANLRAIPHLAQELGVTAGYSDHTEGIEAAVVAAALGARIIEKHFTLDKHFSDFRDHQLSSDPADLKALIERIRLAERLIGDFKKTVQPSEADNVPLLRRSIVAAGNLETGHCLTDADLTWTRPAGGIEPGQEQRLIGRKLKKPKAFGERFALSDVE